MLAAIGSAPGAARLTGEPLSDPGWARSHLQRRNSMTVTLGIDLAAQAAKTALCAIEWADGRRVLPAMSCGSSGARRSAPGASASCAARNLTAVEAYRSVHERLSGNRLGQHVSVARR
jgi:hypothetical protein